MMSEISSVLFGDLNPRWRRKQFVAAEHDYSKFIVTARNAERRRIRHQSHAQLDQRYDVAQVSNTPSTLTGRSFRRRGGAVDVGMERGKLELHFIFNLFTKVAKSPSVHKTVN